MNSSQSMLSALVLLCFAGAAVVDAGLCARVKCGTKNPCRISTCVVSSGVAKCVVKDRKNGFGCSDNNKCTFNDKCKAGTCKGTPKTCPETKNKCTTNLCNPLTGKCVVVAERNGKRCDDGKACTTNDKCRAGRCIGTPKTCSGATGCQSSKCVEPSGMCNVTMKADGATCFEDNKCTVNSTCMSGVCSAGVPKLCTGSQCVSKTCNPATGLCDPTFLSGTACNDGKNCTTGDVCQGGVCRGTPTICLAPATSQCTRTKCNELTGTCDIVNRKNGTSCDDGNKCTVKDVCSAGICAGVPKACPGGQCVSKTCNPATGFCDPTFLSGNTCSDGKKCTTGDVCTNGSCKGTPIICPASGKQCSVLTCVEKTGRCTKLVKSPNGTPCDDGRTGTFNDRCSFGVCKSTKCTQPGNTCIYTVYNEATGTCESKLRGKNFACNKRGGKCDGNGRCV